MWHRRRNRVGQVILVHDKGLKPVIQPIGVNVASNSVTKIVFCRFSIGWRSYARFNQICKLIDKVIFKKVSYNIFISYDFLQTSVVNKI